jgi:hypothetical protein
MSTFLIVLYFLRQENKSIQGIGLFQ